MVRISAVASTRLLVAWSVMLLKVFISSALGTSSLEQEVNDVDRKIARASQIVFFMFPPIEIS
jgi:hypothetical protein